MKQALILFLVICCFESQAQKSYSITLDADNDQFFSVAIGKKTYPSSSIGHLLISGLKDSTYQLLVSFPRSTYTAESFTVNIEKKDRKLLLKKISDKQWNIQDLQTNSWIKQKTTGLQVPSAVNEADLARSREAFKKLMAAVVNDTAILNTEIEMPAPKKEILVKNDPPPNKAVVKDTVKKIEEKTEDSAAIVKKPTTPDIKQVPDSSLNRRETTVKEKVVEKTNDPGTAIRKDTIANADVRLANIDTVRKVEMVMPAQKPALTSIVKFSEVNKTNSKEIAYITRDTAGETDTIHISIPFGKEMVDTKENEVEKKKEPQVPPMNHDTSRVNSDMVDIKPVLVLDTAKNKKDSIEKKLLIVNSDCRNFATEADVDKLRVKMISENRLEERIVIAKKYFKTKCFTTRQVRALTELFVSDKTRYEFFDAAYPFVSDSANFKSLVELLTDEYYIGRFKAMVRIGDSR